MAKNQTKNNVELVIVESPTKVKALKQFFPDKIIKASVGHICEITNTGLYNLGIDVNNNFDINFKISDNKKDVVKDLKTAVEKADIVYLCQDPDREGEAIAYHLKNFLKIPESKIKRATYQEVTKKAVEEALANHRKIDMNMVDAALSRASLDKIVGFRLSPIAKRKVGAKSVGRCQTPALKLVVEREEEINAFKPETYYEIYLLFTKDKKEYKAQYKGLIKEDKNTPTIKDKELAEKIVNDCKGYDYVVHNIESKDRNVSSKDPFITSTFQQEVSSKLGYSVKTAMMYAQKLFEGININGQHVGLCTYLRTDSTTMDPEFRESLKQHILNKCGKEYLKDVVEKKKTSKKKEIKQEGHECFRVVDLEMTPEKLKNYILDNQMLRVYELVYNRTVASMMSDAIITDVNFIIKNGEYKFIYGEHSLKFDGFKKVYALDDEELQSGLDVGVGEKLEKTKLDLQKKSTQPPRRYSEASLIKKLDELNIGRPSTMATILSTLLDPGRGYCEEQGKALVPTDRGITLIHFMKDAFNEIIDYDYTAKMEESLDKIAKGELGRVEYLKSFYADLEKQIKNAKDVQGEKAALEYSDDRTCPLCGGRLIKRHGRFGDFYACENWKYGGKGCNHTEKIV